MSQFVKYQVGMGFKVVPRAMASTLEAVAAQTAAGKPTLRSAIESYALTTLENCGVLDSDGDFITSTAKRVGDFDFKPNGRWG